MVDSKKGSDNKLPYEKPRLRMISLLADEVLAVKCKQAVGSPGMAVFGCGNKNCSLSTGS
jgi:hypothetical protein